MRMAVKGATSLILCVIFTWLMVAHATAEPIGRDAGNRPLLFLGNDSLPPMNFLKNGEPRGVVVDLVKAVAKRMHQPVEIRLMDWAEAQQLVLEGAADALFQINSTPERIKLYDFSGHLLHSEFTIFTSTEHSGVSTINDLHGLMVGVEKKGLPIQLLQKDPEIIVEIIPDYSQGLRMLTTDALDAVVADRWVGGYLLAEEKILGVKLIKEPIARSQSAIAVKKGNTKLLEEINSALADIRRDGTYEKIVSSWQSKEVVFKTVEQLRKESWLLGSLLAALFASLTVVTILVREIRRRKQAETELRKLSRAVEQSPVTIVITDVQGTIEFVNPRFTELTGYTAKEAIGRNPRILKSGKTPPEIYRELWTAITDGKTWEGELVNKRRDGHLFWEHAKISPLRDTEGTVTHYLAVKEDITEKKNIMEQLVAAKAQAEEADRAKSSFLATMSHEIRTPMNGVIGMTVLLLDSGLNDEQRRYAEIVKRSGEHLLTLINDILDFSKIESGKMDLELLDFDLRQTVKEITLMFCQRVAEAGLELIYRIEPTVPLTLKGDPGRLRQIVTNLVGNAIKFTNKGGVTVNVSLFSERDSSAIILFEIKDTGIGIPASGLSAIFEPFTQASTSTTRKFGGTGLGLAICRQLVELMEGEIGVTSEEGVGSTFWFTARFENQASQTSEVLQTKETMEINAIPPATEKALKSSARILLAEDNIINQKVAQSILEKLGYKTDVVANGWEALKALEMIDYDLVLMDCQMPEMDGFEATAMIRDSNSNVINHNVPIIAMTANAMLGDREKCLEAGMSDYLSKPVNPVELDQMLLKWLAGETGEELANPEVEGQEGEFPLLDEVDLLDRLDNDRELMLTILELSLHDLPEKLEDVRVHCLEDNVKTLTLHLHTMKGTAANISAVALHNICHQLETAVLDGGPESARKLLPELERIHNLTIEEIEKACKR